MGALAEGVGCSLVGEAAVLGRGEGTREEVLMGEGATVDGRKAGGEGVSNWVVSVIFWGLGVWWRITSWGVPARVGSCSLGREGGAHERREPLVQVTKLESS